MTTSPYRYIQSINGEDSCPLGMSQVGAHLTELLRGRVVSLNPRPDSPNLTRGYSITRMSKGRYLLSTRGDELRPVSLTRETLEMFLKDKAQSKAWTFTAHDL